jgi:glycosyltransferase involved in cell wall biosynthesis
MPDRLRVLLMSYCLDAGGTERQLANTAMGLDRSRFEPHVGTFHGGGPRHQELCNAGVPVTEFPVRSLASPSVLRAALELRRYLERHAIDILHSFDVPANLFGVPTAVACRVPLVLSSQRACRGLTPGIYHHLLRITDQMVDGIVVNSRALRRELIEQDQVPPGRIHLCPNGIRTDLFYPPAECAAGGLTIGTLCVLRPEKSLGTLLEACARLRPAFPEARLVVVGSGPMLPELEALAARLGVAAKCHFEPATSQVAERLRGFDIFVLPSLSEALSNSLMEAMACGCCAVASDVGGNPELVRHGETGLLFRPADAADLAANLGLVLRDRELRRKLAESGARFIRESFSVETAVRRMESVYLGHRQDSRNSIR